MDHFYEFLCCFQTTGTVQFEHSPIEHSGGLAYIDVFCSLDKTLIQETDCLFLSSAACPNDPLGEKYCLHRFYITREPGNMSGVSRVIFPAASAKYALYYLRVSPRRSTSLGHLLIEITTPLSSNEGALAVNRLYSVPEASLSNESSRHVTRSRLS